MKGRFEPDRKYLVHVSGGRTSGLMLRGLLDECGGELPANARAIFTNTGKEREETLQFVKAISDRWQVPITWLEYRYNTRAAGGRKDPKNTFVEVSFALACRRGEPFEELIESRQMLPNVVMRMCTEELKVNTAKRYARRVLGWDRPESVLGIRYDEPRRWRKALWEECRTRYPLVDARITEADVFDFWRSQPFDLGLGRDEGNCDLCFLKGAGRLERLIADEPGRVEWWSTQELNIGKHPRMETLRNRRHAQFSKRWSYRDLAARAASRLPFLPAVDDPAEERVSCFCGD